MVTVTVTDGKDAVGTVDTNAVADDTIRVTIMVTDVNEAPVFPATIVPIEVAENTVTDTNIGAPVAAMEDPDGDTLTYTLGGTDADSFAIVGDSGQLQTKAALDYETQRDYEVMVTATDDGAGSLSGTIRVIIRVTDDSDDNAAVVNSAPYFPTTEGDGLLTTREVPENTAAGVDIGDPVDAMDADDPDGDTLTYGLLSGADAASFDIDSTT